MPQLHALRFILAPRPGRLQLSKLCLQLLPGVIKQGWRQLTSSFIVQLRINAVTPTGHQVFIDALRTVLFPVLRISDPCSAGHQQ
ncbi:unknown [Bacteroides sp. CAG:633]|nr:unknown [Bacteroides sp. CAG:633]